MLPTLHHPRHGHSGRPWYLKPTSWVLAGLALAFMLLLYRLGGGLGSGAFEAMSCPQRIAYMGLDLGESASHKPHPTWRHEEEDALNAMPMIPP
jgi:hypothetical protein